MKSILNFITESANELYLNASYITDDADIWMVNEKDEPGKYNYIHFFNDKKDAIKYLSRATDKAESLASKVNKTGDFVQQSIDSTNYIFAKII